MISVLLTIASVSVVPPASVNAAPAKSWVISTFGVSPYGNPLKVCEGEKVVFEVFIEKNEGTWTQIPSIGGRFTYPPAFIQSSSSDINAGYITPANANTSLRPDSGRNIVSFSFKAKKKGTTTIKFHDNGGPDRPPASDVTVIIEVKECNYKLVVFSYWIIPRPFLKPRVYSVFEAELIPAQDDRIGPVYAPVENSAHHTQGIPFCSHPVTPNNNEATITGRKERLANLQGEEEVFLDLDISYDLMTATTKYTCTSPVRSFTVPNQGPGETLVLDPQPLKVSAGLGTTVLSLPHTLRAVSDVRGASVIAIIPIYLP